MKEIVSIFLCGKMYGVDIENIQGIENYTDVIRTGGEPGCLDGFVVIRESQIPMINLRKKLVLPLVPVTEETKILIFMTDHGPAGAVVDGVQDILRVEGDNIQQFPTLMKNGQTDYVDYVAKSSKGLVVVMNPAHLLSEEEWGGVNQYKKDLQKESGEQEA